MTNVSDEVIIDDNLTLVQRRRLQDRKGNFFLFELIFILEWEAYWTIRDLDTRGTIYPRIRFYVHKLFDKPATWFREKVVEPLHDKYQIPYYHRHFSRVPEIDQCGVNDKSCIYEANEQFRLDKLVDYYIVQILHDRLKRCMAYNSDSLYKCSQVIEDFELAELNNFIKYGELGSEVEASDCYMKQKHRLIWERRHPEIMKERERKYQEYLEKKKNGQFDMSFWKKGLIFQDKKNYAPPYGSDLSKPAYESNQPLSKDWQYYKKLDQDPEFDKQQGKTSKQYFI